jgi:hypothetical protein
MRQTRRGVAAPVLERTKDATPGGTMALDSRLGHAAVATLGELADVVEEDRFLSRGEVRGVLGYLGQERIVEQDGRLVAVTGGRVAEQGGDIYLQRVGIALPFSILEM